VDGRPVRPSPTSHFMSPWGRVGAPYGPPQPRFAGRSPRTILHRGGPARQPPREVGGGAILGASPVGPPGTVSGPAPDTRPRPWHPAAVSTARRRRVLSCPRRKRRHDPGRPPDCDDRGSTRAPHWGARRLAVLSRPPHLCGPAPLPIGCRDGDSLRRRNCDGPAHGHHTRGTRFPGSMSHYRIFQIAPLATHL